MVNRKAIINNDELEVLQSGDTLAQVASEKLTVTDGTTTVDNVNIVNIVGSKAVAQQHEVDGKAIIKSEAAGGSVFNQVNPYVRSNYTTPNDKVDIHSWRIMLPDKTVQKVSSTKTIDISATGDREGSQTRDNSTWYYIYVTDETGYTNNAFFSKTKPNVNGFHPTLNAKFVSSCLTDSSGYINQFLKHMSINAYSAVKDEWSGSTTSGATYINVTNYMPPIADSFVGFAYSGSTSVIGRAYEINYAGTTKGWISDSCYVYSWWPSVFKTPVDRKFCIASSSSYSSTHLYLNSYKQDVNHVLQNIT